jgi:hypothetical protein
VSLEYGLLRFGSFTLKIEIIWPTETLVTVYQTTQRNVSEDRNLNTHPLGSVNSKKFKL